MNDPFDTIKDVIAQYEEGILYEWETAAKIVATLYEAGLLQPPPQEAA